MQLADHNRRNSRIAAPPTLARRLLWFPACPARSSLPSPVASSSPSPAAHPGRMRPSKSPPTAARKIEPVAATAVTSHRGPTDRRTRGRHAESVEHPTRSTHRAATRCAIGAEAIRLPIVTGGSTADALVPRHAPSPTSRLDSRGQHAMSLQAADFGRGDMICNAALAVGSGMRRMVLGGVVVFAAACSYKPLDRPCVDQGGAPIACNGDPRRARRRGRVTRPRASTPSARSCYCEAHALLSGQRPHPRQGPRVAST
jgi:hypothetical protein